MSELFDDSLISDFVTESREHLDAIEPDLLGMEEGGGAVPAEVINRVFRAIHSIKGGAGFLAYDSLKNLSHSMENVLMMVRDGDLSIAPNITDVLLRGVDKLRAMVDDIQASENVPCEAELAELKALIDGQRDGGVAPQDEGGGTAHLGLLAQMNCDQDAVLELLRHGRFLYLATVIPDTDFSADSTGETFIENASALGEVISTLGPEGPVENLAAAASLKAPFTFLYSSVLEPSLAATALELPEAQVHHVDEAATAHMAAPEGTAATSAPPAATTPAATPAAAIAPQADAVSDGASADSGGGDTAEGPRKAADVADTLRVRVDLLTGLMNSAGELVLARNQLLRVLESHAQEIPGLSAILQNIDHVTTDVQEGIMQTRLQPIGAIFGKFPRVVRDMARLLGKEIAITMDGAEVELDKSILESLSDPMTHIIRNCADHALETAEERLASGKERQGLIELRAYHEGGQVNISIRDNGRGIDADKVARKAIEKGVVTEDQVSKMSNRELVNLVFAPGFSTAEVISEVSGRGVGMDVVRSNIEKLGGTVNLDTVVGEGTTVLLQLPLTLAIIPSLVVGVEEHRFAVPQVNVEEFVWVRAEEVAERIEKVHGQDVLRLRGMLLPLVRLADVLGIKRTYTEPESGALRPDNRQRIADRRSPDDELPDSAEAESEAVAKAARQQVRRLDWRNDYNIVVSKIGGNRFGLIVDKLYDTEEIVVKPLSCFLKQSTCFSGATILGDGCVITILDITGVAEEAQLQFADLEAEEKRRRQEELQREEEARQARRSVIIFNGSSDEYFAIAQDSVLRLERLSVRDIKVVGDQEFLEYRGHGLPLIRLDHFLPVRSLPPESENLFMIIPREGMDTAAGRPAAGILVSRIVDAMDVVVQLREAERSAPGLQGTAIVNDQLTLFLEPDALMASSGIAERNV